MQLVQLEKSSIMIVGCANGINGEEYENGVRAVVDEK